MSEYDEMAMQEADRDEGISSERREAERQAYAAKLMAAEQSCRNQPAGQLLGNYQRPDYDIRASCLEAAVRISSDSRDVLKDARDFYAFLTEKSTETTA